MPWSKVMITVSFKAWGTYPVSKEMLIICNMVMITGIKHQHQLMSDTSN